MKDSSPQVICWPALAGLRFILAAIVLNAHLAFGGVSNPLQAFIRGFGSMEAVMGFLLVSGFSIAHSITVQPQGYLKRRFWRIYPIYIACLALGLLPFYLVGQELAVGPGALAVESVMMTNAPLWPYLLYDVLLIQAFGFTVVGICGQSWSLSVEWIMYLLAPLFIRGGSLLVIGVFSISAAAFVGAKYINVLSAPAFWGLPWGYTIMLCAWAWLAGFHYYKWRARPGADIGFTILILSIIILSGAPTLAPYGAITVTGTCVILVSASRIQIAGRTAEVLSWLGDISYPLYLCHIAVFVLIYARFGFTSGVLHVAAALAVAIVLYYGIDLPMRRFGRAAKS